MSEQIEPFAAANGLVRVYPAAEPTGAALVWAHGGAFAFGDLDMPEAHAVAAELATRGITVVSVDYRLVGEGCRYPAPSDDILTALSWTRHNAASWGVDEKRIAIGGASAGANLVAGAVLRLLHGATVDTETPTKPAELPPLVVLAYPTLLAVQPSPDESLRAALAARPASDRFGPDFLRETYENFLGTSVDAAPLPAVPGLATVDDLVGYPATMIVNSDIDVLRVSGELFGRTLAAAGVPVDVTTELGTTHGHLNRPEEPTFARTLDRIEARISALGATS